MRPEKQKIGILLVNGPLPPPFGGVSTYLAHALPYLCRRRFAVHTVMDKRPVESDAYAGFERAGVRIHYGGGSRWHKGSIILSRGPVWTSLSTAAHLSPGLLLRTIASQAAWIDAAERVLQTESIDIIHAYDYPWVQGFVAAHLAAKYGKKYVQTTFGEVIPHLSEMEQHDAHGAKYVPLVSHVLRRADAVIAMSEHCARELGAVGVAREAVRVMYYGIDLKKFSTQNDGTSVRKEFGWEDRPVVLFLGHIRPRKGPQVLLEAVPGILRAAPRALVIFAGPDFGMVSGLKSRAEVLGVQNSVQFLGPQSDRAMLGLYAACDVFAFPTCTPIECLGLSMVQAMATGKAVVGSNINGIPEVIVDAKTGFLVPPGQPEPLAQRIGQLLTGPKLRASMGIAGRKRAERMFDQDRLVKNLEDLYRSLAPSR